ncbi:MAG TPA: hypothetical protein VGO62_07565 [Myxococcota bacterium]
MRPLAKTGAAVPAVQRQPSDDVPALPDTPERPLPSGQDRPGLHKPGGTRGGAVLSFHALRDPASIASAVAARITGLKTTAPPPMPIELQLKALSSGERVAARTKLVAELADVRVKQGGERVSLLHKLKTAGLPTERILDVMAQVQTGYDRVHEATQHTPPRYQQTNWLHTRLELDRILDVVARAQLSPHEAETAVLASLLSDAVKAPSNFLVHNVHGAQAALLVLSRLVPPPSSELIEDVVKATLEHQIGPPGFMGNVAMKNALKGAGVDDAIISSIVTKVSNPLEPAHLTADRAQIAFSPAEHEALARVGVPAWTVPHEGSRHYRAARAVIDADSLVNYACPDGWAKLAELHGPDQPPFLQEPLLRDSLLSEKPQHASAIKSFRDARSVVSEGSRPLYERGLLRTQLAIERVDADLRNWASVQHDAPAGLPYLERGLDYSKPLEVEFARRLRNEGVRLLRQYEVTL